MQNGGKEKNHFLKGLTKRQTTEMNNVEQTRLTTMSLSWFDVFEN
jgi:hypothetical protein